MGRWTLVCGIAAAPSFFWGCALHSEFPHIVGMIAGVLVFVIAYTVVECTHFYRQVVSRPHIRRTLLIGYGTRLLVSVIFPIGLTIDMLTGVVSVAIIQNVLLGGRGELAERGAAVSGVIVFLTTVLQGIFLNIMLFGYMFCVFGLLRGLARLRENKRESPRDEGAVTAAN